ncbi:MAG: FAD dependent oxidoreductase [Comamonadaceae bacterium]|nr:MAG: FAD dependent oxidoreductase [Comamonadaceae bacterium]
MAHVDCVVIGAGVVGLAVARSLALAAREVFVLEAAGAIGTATSSRNSEVIHAGIYYKPESLKAQLCVAGNKMLYAYCEARGIAHRRCGKLIVASGQQQADKLVSIEASARSNGVADLVWLDRHAALQLEPQLVCDAALLSPSTGIVDSHALMQAFQADIENSGGTVVLHSSLMGAKLAPSDIELTMKDGTRLTCKVLVNAAGLWAPALAHHFSGLSPEHIPTAFYAKGNYFSLMGKAPFRHLIYPIPEEAGLGVHLTLDLGGQAKFGPDVQWVDSADDLVVDAARADAFYAEVRKYWPALQDGALQPAFAGMRPKISGPNEAVADFVIQGASVHGHAGLINLFGIESPGLTSSLAIGEAVLKLLKQQFSL